MIQFRCWYCNKRYAKSEDSVGRPFVCSCAHRLKVPKKSGGSSRNRSLTDWLIEIVVYGGGGGILGFLLAIVIISQTGRVRIGMPYWGTGLILGLTLLGFLIGGFGGEKGINWIGRQIRRHEE
jgi:hypothetical protein